MTDIELRVLRRGADGYWHKCPACGHEHPLPDRWAFDGNLTRPTFTPSFRQIAVTGKTGEDCHYNITDGQIVWHADSYHGRTGTEPMVHYDTEAIDGEQ